MLNGHWEVTAVQRWAGSRYIPPALTKAQNANRDCSVHQQKTGSEAVRQIPVEKDMHVADKRD